MHSYFKKVPTLDSPIQVIWKFRYYLSNEKATWNSALQICLSNGGNLACINSEAENILVSEMLNTGDYSETGVNTSRMWIGITDSLSEGDYQWMSGEEVLFENWAIGHPQDIVKILIMV